MKCRRRLLSWRWGPRLLLLMLAVWSFGIEPRWLARRDIVAPVAEWPAPLRIAVASDWHVVKGAMRWWPMTTQRAAQLVREINAAQPDLILLPGDFIDAEHYRPDPGHTAEEEIAAILSQLKAPLGVFAVLGNHDWWHGGAQMADALRRRGIVVLENEAVPLKGAPLWLVGIGDHFSEKSDPARAFAKVPAGAPAVVMMHDPASLLSMPAARGFMVAGHTHGGQVSLPFIGALVIPSVAPRAWAHGWVEHGGHRMYVGSGLGTSILPVRFNIRPEWMLFTVARPRSLQERPD